MPLGKKRGNGESGNRRGFSCLRFSPSPVLRFGAIAPRTADTARPPTYAPQCRPLQPAPRPAPSTLPPPVLFFHTPRPAGRDYTAVTAPALCPERRLDLGVSAQFPPPRGRVWPMSSLVRQLPTIPIPETPAR